MSFEQDINKLNEYFFFKEFTYSDNKFKKPDGQEVEIADSIIYLDQLAFVFQLKERVSPPNRSPESETKWFKDKVIRLGTKQIRDTITYISEYQNVTLANNRGDFIDIPSTLLSAIHKVIVHKSSTLLPDDYRNKKFHKSSTAGVIHIFQASDYLGVLQYLITPAELSEYLKFRKNMIQQYRDTINDISEPAMLGQYLSGDEESRPSEKFSQYLSHLDNDIDSWDMTGVIKNFPERIIEQQNASHYYLIIKEIAKLKRNELMVFKERFMLSWNAVKNDEDVTPYRFQAPGTGCAFYFLPLPKKKKGLKNALGNLTLANKYDLKSDKAIGISFIAHKNGWQNIDWCFIQEPWEENSEMEEFVLKARPLLRPLSEKWLDTYKFK